MSLKRANNVDRSSRAAEKAESRRRDLFRIEQGEDPGVLQRQNSIFPRKFFQKGKISNLAQAIGR